MSDCEKADTPADMGRRAFLKGAIAAMGALIAAVVGGAGTGFFLSPLFRKQEETWIEIGKAADFLPDTPTKVEYVERKRDAWVTTEQRSSVWVLTSNGKDFAAFDPRCTHLGCPYRWSADKKQFLCPCHNGVFALDGSVVSGPPPRALDRYTTKVVDGRLLVLPKADKKATA